MGPLGPALHAVETWVFLAGAGADPDVTVVERHDPRFTDHLTDPDDLGAELDAYDRGTFTFRRQDDLHWSDAERSRATARRVFGWPDPRS